jgi:hypothetical protein
MRRVGVGSRIASEVGRVEVVFSGDADQSELKWTPVLGPAVKV